MADTMLECLVADSAAFLKNAQLHTISNRVFTVQDVIHEIRDSATRQRLAVLPYKIEFRAPSTEAIKTVSEFAMKTGDFPSLSAVDVKVIALTYQLEKEFCSRDHIREEPVNKIERMRGGGITVVKPEHGFYFDKKTQEKKEKERKYESENVHIDKEKEEELEKGASKDDCQMEENEKNDIDQETGLNADDDHVENGDQNNDDDDDDDGGGWITPGNISKVKKEMGFDEVDESPIDAKCACLTTDFAMQNVLMQMGLHVISLDGMIIRQARSYILKCYGCTKETTEMDRIFCKNCGNKTLKKVSVTVNTDGSLTYHYPKRMRPMNLRGTKYSIPLPKAGRHASNVILVEDQKLATQRLPKTKDTANALDQDYIARTSPFTYKDVTSKAFNKGFHLKQDSRRNPNEGRKTKSRRK